MQSYYKMKEQTKQKNPELTSQSAVEEAEQIDRLNEQAWALRDRDIERALALSQEAHRRSNQGEFAKETYLQGFAQSLTVLSFIDFRRGRYQNALERISYAIEIFEKTQQLEWLPWAYNVLGIIYSELGDRVEGTNLLLKQLRLSQELGDLAAEAMAYNDLAANLAGSEFEKQIDYYSRARDLSRQANDQGREFVALYNLGMTYLADEAPEQALVCFQESEDLSHTMNPPTGEGLVLIGTGEALRVMGKYEQASDALHTGLHFLRQSQSAAIILEGLIPLAKLLIDHSQYDNAIDTLYEALDCATAISHKRFICEAHKLFSQTYRMMGDFEKALDHYTHYHCVNEELFNQETEHKIANMQILYQVEKAEKEAEIYQLRYVELQREVEERQQAEAAFIQAQKHESLGVMASGIAHDFNNLLVGIIAQGSLSLHKMGPEHPAYPHIGKALKSARRAAELTQQMLAYSGAGRLEISDVNLNEIIKQKIELLNAIVPSHVSLQTTYADKLPSIQADPTQIYQIIVNLVTNAVEACQGASHAILLKTDVKTITEEMTASNSHYWHYTGAQKYIGEHVLLSVKDDGSGMSDELLNKLYDPFYSTKFIGRGLGLAAVLGIVRSHHGGISVTSQVGVGTQFRIIFPTDNAEPLENSE